MSLDGLCRTTGTLKRKTLVKDANAAMTISSFTAVSGYSNVPCDVQPARGSVRMQYMQESSNVTHTVYSETEIPGRPEDVFIVAGRTFQFRGREQPPPGYEGDEWPAQMHVEEQLG